LADKENASGLENAIRVRTHLFNLLRHPVAAAVKKIDRGRLVGSGLAVGGWRLAVGGWHVPNINIKVLFLKFL
jgi:hypothetical protein